MDSILQDFTLIGIGSLAITIVVLVSVTKRVLMLVFPWLEKDETASSTHRSVRYENATSKLYNELFLYILPYLWALLLAIPKIEFVYAAITSYSGRAIFGCLVATFSGLIYKSARKAFPKLFGVELTEDELGEDP